MGVVHKELGHWRSHSNASLRSGSRRVQGSWSCLSASSSFPYLLARSKGNRCWGNVNRKESKVTTGCKVEEQGKSMMGVMGLEKILE